MARTVTYTLKADTDHFEAGMKRSKTSAQDFFKALENDAKRLFSGKKLSEAFKDVGQGMTAAFTAPIVGAFGAVVAASATFDREMVKSMSIMGNVSTDTRKKLEDNARSVAKSLGVSHEEAAKSYYFLASAGLSVEQSMQALRPAAEFAKAGFMDMNAATELLMDSQSALGLRFQDSEKNAQAMTRVSDVITKASILSNASIQQLGDSLSTKSAAAMRTFNISVEEGTAVLAAYADQGVKGRLAGERFDILLRELTTQARENSSAFKEANIAVFNSSGGLRNLGDIVGDIERRMKGMTTEQKIAQLATLGFRSEANSAILALTGFSEKIKNTETALRSAGGATKEVAEKNLKSFTEQANLLKIAATDVAISLGEKLLPVAQRIVALAKTDLVPVVTSAVDWFKKLPEPVQNGALALTAFVAAAGPVSWALGAAAGTVGSMVTAVKTLAASSMVTWLVSAASAATGFTGVLAVATAGATAFFGVGAVAFFSYGIGTALRSLIDDYFPKVSKWLDQLAQQAYDWWTGMNNAQRSAGKGGVTSASFPTMGKSRDTGITSYGFDWSSPEGKRKLDEIESAAKKTASATVVAFGAVATGAGAAAGPVNNLKNGVGGVATELTKVQKEAAKALQAFKESWSYSNLPDPGEFMGPRNPYANPYDVWDSSLNKRGFGTELPGDEFSVSSNPLGVKGHGRITNKEIVELRDGIKEADEASRKAKESAARWAGALQGVALIAGAIGGKIGETATVMMNIGKSFEGWSKMDKFGKFNAIAGGVGQIGGLVGGKTGGAIQGAAGGAMSAFAMSGGNPLAAVAGGVLGGLAGLFGASAAKKKEVADLKTQLASLSDAAKALGIDLTAAFNSKSPTVLKAAIEQVTQAVEAQKKRVEGLSVAAGGLNSFVGGGAVTDQASLDRSSLYAGAIFGNMVKDSGDVVAALQAIGPALSEMAKKAEELGLSLGAGVANLIGMNNVLGANEGLAEQLSGLNQMMKGLGDAGLMTRDLFVAFGADASAVFARLVEGGATGNQALTLMQPTLQQLYEGQKRHGWAVDETTQALIDEAKAQGIVGDQFMSANERIVELLGILIEAVGGQLPDAYKRAGESAEEYGRRASASIPTEVTTRHNFVTSYSYEGEYHDPTRRGGPVEDPGAGNAGGSPFRQYGAGTRVTLHGEEAVLRRDQVDELLSSVVYGPRNAPLSSSGTNVTFGDINVIANDAQGGRDAAEEFKRMLSVGEIRAALQDSLGLR